MTGARPAFLPFLGRGDGTVLGGQQVHAWFSWSTVIVRAPRSVFTVSTGSHFPFTSLTIVSVPSPFELNASA